MTKRIIGIHISEKEGLINWKEVGNSQLQFGFVRATDGDSVLDSQFDRNWLGLRNAGMLRGAVHIFRPTINPQKQAEFFIDCVADISHSSDLPPALLIDVNQRDLYQEYYQVPMAQRINHIRVWLEIVTRVIGKTPLIFTNRNTWQYTLGNNDSFAGYPLWIGQENVGAPTVFCDNWLGHSWNFWQFSSQGAVRGIRDGLATTQMNLFNGSMEELHAFSNFSITRPLLEEMSNAQFTNALFATSDVLSISALNFLEQCDCRYLIKSYVARNRIYNGLAVGEMNLNIDEAKEFRSQLVQVLSQSQFYLEHITNQEMINAIYSTAMILNMNGWALLDKAGLTDLLNDPSAQYTGSAIEDLPLSVEEKSHLMEMIGVRNADSIAQEQSSPIYHELVTNQDMINCVYQAAILLNMKGIELLKKAGLTSLLYTRVKTYVGEKISEIETLSANEIAILQDEIDKIIPFGDEETYGGLLNQDMINIFYLAGTELNISGWSLLKKAKLERITESAKRFEVYCGPALNKIESLSNDEILLIEKLLKSYAKN